ncbi:hypothetical protein PAV_2c02140 [Paenibacillus alvei DSM 29]|nr:hypothetical protein PAV_2c02140 [Paenibacillus alvei DSM 29]
MYFTGETSADSDASKVHESPLSMTMPLIVLSILAIVAGFINTPFGGSFGSWLTGEEAAEHANVMVMIVSALIGVLGIGLGYVMYGPGRKRQDTLEQTAAPLYRLLANKYYVDELYHIVFVRSLTGIGLFLKAIDKWIIDGLVRLVTWFTVGIGRTSLRLQSGQLQTYGLVSLFGFVGMILLVLALGRRFW